MIKVRKANEKKHSRGAPEQTQFTCPCIILALLYSFLQIELEARTPPRLKIFLVVSSSH